MNIDLYADSQNEEQIRIMWEKSENKVDSFGKWVCLLYMASWFEMFKLAQLWCVSGQEKLIWF